MLLFHFTIGYPLLDADTYLVFPDGKVTPRDADAEKGVGEWNRSQPPTAGYREQVFYHDLQADPDGMIAVAVHNDNLNKGLVIHFSKKQFPYFTQWKQMGEGEYVMGLEPCNCYVDGRLAPRNQGVIDYLEPGESRSFDIGLEVFETDKNMY
jgi:galactose mutarotase-like enzyme